MAITTEHFDAQTYYRGEVVGQRVLYDERAEASYRGPQIIAQAISERLHSGIRLLEAGVGTGYFAEQIAKQMAPHKPRYFGMDITPCMLEICRTKGVCEEAIKADINKPWPFAAQSMQGIFVCGVMEHIKDPQNLVMEAARVLEPGGFLALAYVPVQPNQLQRLAGLFGGSIAVDIEKQTARGRHDKAVITELLKRNRLRIIQEKTYSERYVVVHGNGWGCKHQLLVCVKI